MTTGTSRRPHRRRDRRPIDAPQPRLAATSPAPIPEADAAALAWTTAFDSTSDFATKAPFIADAEALRPTIEAYTPAGEAVGGIALVPTSIVDHRRHRGDHLRRDVRRPDRLRGPGRHRRTRRRGVDGQPRRVLRLHGRGPEPLRRVSGLAVHRAVLGPSAARSGTVGSPVRRARLACCRRARARHPGSIAVGAKSIPLSTRPRRPLRLRPDEQRPPDRALAARAARRSSGCSSAPRSARPAR